MQCFATTARSFVSGCHLRRLIAFFATAFAFGVSAHAAEPLRVAFMIGEDEYNAKETLPAFAEKNLRPLGVECTMIHSDPQQPNSFPDLAKIDDADVLVVYVRRRPLPKDDMARIHKFLDSGKPLIGIRTACHAFAGRGGQASKKSASSELVEWANFDAEALGGHYTGHFANKEGTDVAVLNEAKSHPILAGISELAFHSGGTLYKCGELDDKAVTLLNGTTTNDGQRITQPVAWTHQYGKSHVFFTTLGHPDDFKTPAFNRLLVNAIFWAADRAVQPATDK